MFTFHFLGMKLQVTYEIELKKATVDYNNM